MSECHNQKMFDELENIRCDEDAHYESSMWRGSMAEPEYVPISYPKVIVHSSPKYKWALYVGGKGSQFIINMQTAPNWFYRKMQSIFLGFYYEKIK